MQNWLTPNPKKVIGHWEGDWWRKSPLREGSWPHTGLHSPGVMCREEEFPYPLAVRISEDSVCLSQ